MWAEELPDQCPPSEAYSPNGETVYRMTSAYPPLESDFYSPRKLKPERVFPDPECRARALSVFKDVSEAIKLRQVSKVFRNHVPVEIVLNQDCGVILHSPEGGPTHHDWWMFRTYVPGNSCAEVAL